MFGNEGDRPYLLEASPESLAAMAAVIAAVKGAVRVPFGVNYLWDPVATVALAVATDAVFAREIFTGVYDSDMGLWQPSAAKALRMRHDLGRDDLKLMFNVNAEFAAPVGDRSVEAARGERRLLVACRRRSGLGPDDRPGGGPVEPGARRQSRAGHAGPR